MSEQVMFNSIDRQVQWYSGQVRSVLIEDEKLPELAICKCFAGSFERVSVARLPSCVLSLAFNERQIYTERQMSSGPGRQVSLD